MILWPGDKQNHSRQRGMISVPCGHDNSNLTGYGQNTTAWQRYSSIVVSNDAAINNFLKHVKAEQ